MNSPEHRSPNPLIEEYQFGHGWRNIYKRDGYKIVAAQVDTIADLEEAIMQIKPPRELAHKSTSSIGYGSIFLEGDSSDIRSAFFSESHFGESINKPYYRSEVDYGQHGIHSNIIVVHNPSSFKFAPPEYRFDAEHYKFCVDPNQPLTQAYVHIKDREMFEHGLFYFDQVLKSAQNVVDVEHDPSKLWFGCIADEIGLDGVMNMIHYEASQPFCNKYNFGFSYT